MSWFEIRSSSAASASVSFPALWNSPTWATRPFSTSTAPAFSPFATSLYTWSSLTVRAFLLPLFRLVAATSALRVLTSSRMNASGCHR